MTNFKEELKKARAANDFKRAAELWKELCQVAEIPEVNDGDPGGAEDIAALRNMRSTGKLPGGKQI